MDYGDYYNYWNVRTYFWLFLESSENVQELTKTLVQICQTLNIWNSHISFSIPRTFPNLQHHKVQYQNSAPKNPVMVQRDLEPFYQITSQQRYSTSWPSRPSDHPGCYIISEKIIVFPLGRRGNKWTPNVQKYFHRIIVLTIVRWRIESDTDVIDTSCCHLIRNNYFCVMELLRLLTFLVSQRKKMRNLSRARLSDVILNRPLNHHGDYYCYWNVKIYFWMFLEFDTDQKFT